MAQVPVSALSKAQKDELVVTYAALLLHDGELEITEEKLNKVISASANSVEGYWPGLFAKALKGRNINDLIANAGASASAPASAPAASSAPVVAEKPKESKCRLQFSILLRATQTLQMASEVLRVEVVELNTSRILNLSDQFFRGTRARGRRRHG
jgi:large subunit ribosomal protein LP1